ncbi:BA14K family protein [Roseibium sediminicola]|uniref:BA14K family protein n=1 Tax=Roseibium sediminicola TaxID=2933272 RepID=UPI0031F31CF7
MTATNFVSKVTLALAVAAVVLPMSGAAMAGGYGYGSKSGWSGYQAHASKRQHVRSQVYAGSNRHLAWCFNRYRSYRLMDNSFQPYHGPRQECLSPYEQERRALFVGYPGEAPEILFRDQAGVGLDETGRDAFGNLSETTPAGAAPLVGTGDEADAFGNLPEQAAVNGAPAVESQPVATSSEGAAPEQTPVNASETDQPSTARSAAETDVSARPSEVQPAAAVLAAPAPGAEADVETATE